MGLPQEPSGLVLWVEAKRSTIGFVDSASFFSLSLKLPVREEFNNDPWVVLLQPSSVPAKLHYRQQEEGKFGEIPQSSR